MPSLPLIDLHRVEKVVNRKKGPRIINDQVRVSRRKKSTIAVADEAIRNYPRRE
jgi:hypothetical protein